MRHDLAGTRSLLVVPQCDERRGRARMGRLQARTGFRRFLAELLAETLATRLDGPHTPADVESVTLVESNAGGLAIANLLDLDGRVRNVVLFDSLYGAKSIFPRWLRAGDPARLVATLRPALRDQLALEPRTSMTEAARSTRATAACAAGRTSTTTRWTSRRASPRASSCVAGARTGCMGKAVPSVARIRVGRQNVQTT